MYRPHRGSASPGWKWPECWWKGTSTRRDWWSSRKRCGGRRWSGTRPTAARAHMSLASLSVSPTEQANTMARRLKNRFQVQMNEAEHPQPLLVCLQTWKICDIISSSPLGPREKIQRWRKRRNLASGSCKSSQVYFLLLETKKTKHHQGSGHIWTSVTLSQIFKSMFFLIFSGMCCLNWQH